MRSPSARRAGRVTVVACFVLLVISGACRKKPAETTPAEASLRGRVSLAPTASAESTPVDWLTRVFPARYSEPLLPEFPPVALAKRVEGATVRVEFIIGVDGLAHEIEASVVGEAPHADAFVAACETALRDWRFSPAWRLSRTTDGTDEPVVLLPSDSFLVFRFDLAAQASGAGVDVSFEEPR